MAGMYIEIPFGQEKVVYTTTFGGREHFLGQPGMTPDGRRFRWAFSGGAIPAGHLVAGSAGVANEDMDLAVQTAAAVGDLTLSVTTGGAVAENLYQDGLVYTNAPVGGGHVYIIRSHPATTGAATLVLTLYEPIREALTTAASQVGLYKNQYKDVVDMPTTVTAATIGVAPTEITDNDYFWLQTGGNAAVLVDTACVLGEPVKVSDNTAGAIELLNRDATNEDDMTVGVAVLIAAVGADYQLVALELPE